MILADKQIIQLCKLPKFVIVRKKSVVQNIMNEEGVSIPKLVPVTTYEYSYLTINEINDVATEKKDNSIIDIRELTEEEIFQQKVMIYPFSENQIRENELADGTIEKIISYGCGPYSYDLTLSSEFKVFTNINSAVIDPKDFNEKTYTEIKTDMLIVPPNSFVLGKTNEYINMPNVLTGILLSKSTYARVGLNMFATVVQCGFSGQIVLEFANTTSLPIKLHANEGCAQMLFLRGDTAPSSTYADQGGKYMYQTSVQTSLL